MTGDGIDDGDEAITSYTAKELIDEEKILSERVASFRVKRGAGSGRANGGPKGEMDCSTHCIWRPRRLGLMGIIRIFREASSSTSWNISIYIF